jgi:hypothetical protein
VSVKRRLVWIFVVFLSSCGGVDAGVHRELRAAEATEAAQRSQTQRLVAEAELLIGDYEQVSRELENAANRWRSAAAYAERASHDYAAAETAFNQAARNYQIMTYILLAAASYDIAAEVCAGVESTQQYRRRLGLVGERSVCVDHVFAHALGGINHRWNYAPIDCRLNSSYGASFAPKIADMPIELMRGLAVSAIARLRCGGSAAAWSR